MAYYPPGVAAPTPYWYEGAPDEASATRVRVTAGETVVLNDQSF